MTYAELNKAIDKKVLSNTYFLYGAETFLIDKTVAKLMNAVVDPATKDFNFDLFYGGEVEAGKIVDAANAYPMMAESRMVIVKDLHKLPPSGLEFLGKYLEKPAPTTKLVLVSTKIDSRGKDISKIKAKTSCIEFKPLYDRQIPGWMRQYLRERGYKINDDAAMLIHERVGNDLRTIVNELDKIILNLGESTTIAVEDVQKIVGTFKNFSFFDLNDALGARDLHKSLMMLSQMLESGESATGILARIARYFVNLVKLKGATAQGESTNDMASTTGIPTFFIKKTLKMANNYDRNELQRVFESLLEADLCLKTSQQPPLVALQGLVVRIVSRH
ncbi:DNA polymerase III subunit delta [bacterium]|nr:DNA polymerase III subunit delta [bacterium]